MIEILGQNKHVGEVEQNKDDQVDMKTDENISNQQEDSNRAPQYCNQNEVNNEGLQRLPANQKTNKSSRPTVNQIWERLHLRQLVNMTIEDACEQVARVDDVIQKVQEFLEVTGSPRVSDCKSDVANADMINEDACEPVGVDEMQQVQQNDDAGLPEEATGNF